MVSRRKLANIVIACDAVICLIFACNIWWLGRSISLEQYYINKDSVQMTDYAVRVKNLPEDGEGYANLDDLQAQLEEHIARVVEHQPPVYSEEQQSQFVKPWEIASFHFAQAGFERYE